MCLSGTNNQILVIDFNGTQIALRNTGISGTTWEIESLQYDWNGGWYMNGNVIIPNVASSAGGSLYYIATSENPSYTEIINIAKVL